jgi:uncharacterized protein (DUF1810 family)
MKQHLGTKPTDLGRFIDAQATAFGSACRELRSGRKTGHWIWYVFPQLKGLGVSSTSEFYGISSLAEVKAFLAHPVLGPRLVEATQIILAVQDRSLRDILGTPDDLKFRSCMTLFEHAAEGENIFSKALARYCGGKRDLKTLTLLGTKPA